MRHSIVSLATALLISHAAVAGTLIEEVTRHAQKNFPEFLELLAIDNVAAVPQDIRRNAAYLEQSFRRRGFEVRLLDNPAGRPAVFARLPGAPAGTPTLLFYIHFDGQPVIPAEWSQPSPFEPVVKKRDAAGQWQLVPRKTLFGSPLDPELRVFER